MLDPSVGVVTTGSYSIGVKSSFVVFRVRMLHIVNERQPVSAKK